MIAPKVPIEKISKMPLAYALMIVGGLLGVFIPKVFDQNEDIIKSYKVVLSTKDEQIKKLTVRCDSITNFWQSRYLAQLEQARDLQRSQDSTNRSILNKPNLDLQRVIKTKGYEQN